MIISISTPTFDLSGHVIIQAKPDSTTGELRRRVSRVATLDGGVAVNDRGFSDGDRDLPITWYTVSQEHSDLVARLIRLYPLLTVAMRDGVYLAAPESFTPGVKESTLNMLITRKLTP